MTKKQRAMVVLERLRAAYPDAECSLDYGAPHELLIATRLSAQCTDARVNIVAKELFSTYTSVEAFANAELSDIERIIKSCGLYKTKAKDIILMSQMLLSHYGGVVPDTIEELTKLPGIGRKTANLIVGDVYGKPAVVTDTHVIRITGRIGLVATKEPAKVEAELRKLLPPDESAMFCHRLVWHGRAVCMARNPQCGVCTLVDCCKYGEAAMNGGTEPKKKTAVKVGYPQSGIKRM